MIRDIAIQLDNSQVITIVVWDLIDKYKSNVERGENEWASAFEKVLRYYLSDSEMSRLKMAITAGTLPSNPLELFK